ncbi:MAG: hypothetical protein HY321_09895 [Armatimonadetes bacterium]|nr:hypothetical protein [Armatimonadota bacterium]
MYCVACRRSTSLPGARYCVHCGAPLDAPLWSGESAALMGQIPAAPAGEQVACPRCGKANARDHAHCAFCGVRLEGARPALVVDDAARDRARELAAEARESLAEGRLQRVEEQCLEALRADPGSAEAHALLAEVYWSKGSLGGALHEMTEAVRLAPENREWEKRLRDLREEQDRAVAPILRELREPTARPIRRSRPPAARPAWKAPQLPSWAPGVALVVGLMLLLAVGRSLPLLGASLRGLMSGVGLLIGVLAAIFVYYDARGRGMALPVALLWGAIILLAGPMGLVALLVYLLITRARQ